MDIETSEQKEIKVEDINIPKINEDSNKIENTIPENNQENNEPSSEPKLILKKKVNKLKKPQENSNSEEEQINIPNLKVEIINNNNNNIIENEKNKEIKIEEEKNKGYLDDDLEDEDNKKLYLRVIKRMEKTYKVPIISAKIDEKNIDDIGLEENIRPILIGKDIKNMNDFDKNKSTNIKLKNNINICNKNNQNNIKINNYINYINNINNQSKGPYINNNYVYNNNNLINSQNFNYRNDYTINNPRLYNKNIYNNGFPKKYGFSMGKNNNYMNSRLPSNKACIINQPRKYSYERDKNFQKRLNNKYPIYKPNVVDSGNYNFNYKNLKYNIGNIGNYPSNYINLKLNQRKYNYPLKRTYYISYNNRCNPEPNVTNSKANKYKNYFNINSINNINNKTPLFQKSTLKYFNQYKNNTKNYNNILSNYTPTKNALLNRSQNILKTKNNLYNYSGISNKYAYGIRNRNLFSSVDGSIDILNKKLNKNHFRSFNNYNLNFNYEDNINDDSNTYSPMKNNNKFTYYINSRYN